MLNISTQQNPHHDSNLHHSHPSIKLICQHASLHEQTTQCLKSNGFEIANDGTITLIVDSFHGNALLTLEFQYHRNVIGMTSNPCHEYQANLLEFGAKAVVSPVGNNTTLFQAIQAVAKLEPFQSVLPPSAQLTATERRILHLIANGLENKEIARTVRSSDNTVRNQVSVILDKISSSHPELKLENRTQLTLYYWGMWDVLTQKMTIVM